MILCTLKGFSQYERTNIETDSTGIELTKNSVYRIWEETYKNKDSVFYSVRYIKDTAQLNIEGWKRKNGQYFGKWSEYKIDGSWLYTIDYTNHSWELNKEEFKYQSLKDSIKEKADKTLIDKFGLDFFHNNVVFNFYGHTAIRKWLAQESGTFLVQDKYLGSWDEPISQRPNLFVLDYTIRLADNEIYDDMLRIEVDSAGNLISEPSRFEIGFNEIVVPKKTRFSITRKQALQICQANKLEDSKTGIFQAALRFGWRKMAEYPGEFYYEVVQEYNEAIKGDCNFDCTITKFFNVWRFDPWTSKLIFRKPMKQTTRWNHGCGVTGNYLGLND